MLCFIVFFLLLLPSFIFVGIAPPAPRTLLTWPGGLREAIKSAVPEGASGVLNNFIKSFAKSFANPAGLFGLFLSKKLF